MTDNQFIIVVAGYNNIGFVAQNADSILAQDYKNYKIAFFDDASTDGTDKAAIEAFGLQNPNITYTLQTVRKYKTWFFSELESHITINDNDILVFLDGDDFFACENVLSYINEIYKQTHCWMTYGGMLVWNGGDNYVEPFPQNSEIPEAVKRSKTYRKDMWRTSHLKTMRGFVWKHIDKAKDLIPSNVPMVGPDDLAIMFAALELCPSDKIYRVTEPLYIYNHSQKNQGSRAFTDHKATGIDYESMVRNREPYSELSIVTPTLAGGLGNQIFEIAAAASIAKDNNAVLVINPNEHILPNQGNNVKNYLSNIFHKIATDPSPKIESIYSWEHSPYKPIEFSKNMKLTGHYQSYKYFDHNREYIQNLFLPLQSNKDFIMDDFAAIQVRRGDYIKFPNHHPQLTPKYYMDAVKMANPSRIVIYSDDIQWCKDNLKFNVPTIYSKNDTDWKELIEMSYYKNIIISNSSFGWWAAYLNPIKEKRVFVPSIWFGPAILSDGFKMEDLILPEWNIVKV